MNSVGAREPSSRPLVAASMIDPAFYRRHAEQARPLAETMNRRVVRRTLLAAAKKYDEIVEDLERGYIRTRHAELMP